MLTISDIPPAIEDAYARSKEDAHTIFSAVFDASKEEQVTANTNLYEAWPDNLLYIVKGMYKFYFGNKFIRFYSPGDLVSIPENTPPEVTLCSEFGSRICRCPRNMFEQGLLAHDLCPVWSAYCQSTDLILHGLCAAYVDEDFTPQVNIREFEKDAVIISEGDPPHDLYEMVEGEARVTVNGTEIGMIRQGETFGEISFLTGNRRTATVVATKHCMVQIINVDDFEKIARYRPNLVFALSKTLARRLTEVNERLIKICSVT